MNFSRTVKRAWNENRLLTALLELTYACNLDCTFCYNDLALDGTPLALDQYLTLLDDLASMQVLHLTLSGGEPLAHPNFYEIGSHARKLGFVTRIKSNGHAINARVAGRIREEIDPFIIDVSIHGARAETHDRQTRVPGSFDRLIANIGHMKSAGLRVKTNCVLTRWNEDEVAALLSLADELGVILAIDTEVKPRDDGDRSPLEIEATESGRRAHREAFQEFEAKRGVTAEPLDPAELRESRTGGLNKHCGAGASTLTVDPFGNVLPCVQWRVAVGNLHEQSVAQIWQGSTALEEIRETNKAVREQIASLGDAGPSVGFCPGAAHTYHGDPLAMYPTARARLDAATREVVRLRVL